MSNKDEKNQKTLAKTTFLEECRKEMQNDVDFSKFFDTIKSSLSGLLNATLHLVFKAYRQDVRIKHLENRIAKLEGKI